MIGGVRPRRLPNLVAAALLGANGLLGVLFAFNSYQTGYGWEGWSAYKGQIHTTIGINAVTTVAFIVFPFLFPRPLLSARRERVFLAACFGLLLLNWVLLFIPGLSLINDWADPVLRYTLFYPFFAGLIAGTVLLLDVYLSAPSPILRTQALFILGAYVMKCSTYVPALWSQPISGSVPLAAYFSIERVVTTAAIAAVVVSVPVALVSSRLRRLPPRAGPRPYLHDVFLLACALYGLHMFHPILAQVLASLEYMFFRPILFAYGILQFQLLQVDLRARKGIVTASVLVVLATVFLVLSDRAQLVGVSAPVAVGLALLATLAVSGLFLAPFIKALFAPATLTPDPRGQELYRAALEQAVAAREGHDTTNQRILETLRNRLQISAREHSLMEASVRSLFGRGGDGPMIGQTFLSRYRIERLLGEGGFGRTFLAHDSQMGRAVALKAGRISSELEAKRALKEARVAARLRHPNVVAIHDVEEVGGDIVLILEYVEGGSLRDRMAKTPMTVAESFELVRDILSGLEAAHAEGIVHRDLKPENILLTADGRAKLADFGVARGGDGTGTVTGLSVAGNQPGSLHYMAPEQVRGDSVDARTDLYALGVVWYEALAGRPYLNFRGRGEFDARLAILDDAPRLPIPSVPQTINRVLDQLLSKNPDRRPASAAALRKMLEKAGPGTMVTGPATADGSPVRRKSVSA